MINKVEGRGEYNIESIGLVDNNTYEYKLISSYRVKQFLDKGGKIENLGFSLCGFEGTNGSLDRYPTLNMFGKPINNKSITIINQIVDDKDNTIGYDVSSYDGIVKRLRLADVIKLGRKLGITNGRIMDVGKVKYIYSICGEYPKIDASMDIERRKAKVNMIADKIDNFQYGKAKIYVNNKVGVINSKYELVLKPEFDTIDYREYIGIFMVVRDGKHGVYDKEGNLIIDTIYSRIYYNHKDESFTVLKDGLNGVVDIDGSVVVPPIYSGIYGTSDKYYIVVNQGKFGCIDNNSNIIIPLEYEYIRELKRYDNCIYFKVKKSNCCGVIDLKGNIIVDIKYNDISLMYKNVCIVKLANGCVGAINIDTKEFVIKPIYKSIENFRNDICIVQSKEGLYGFVDINGKHLTGCEFYEILNYLGNDVVKVKIKKRNKLNEDVISEYYVFLDGGHKISVNTYKRKYGRALM